MPTGFKAYLRTRGLFIECFCAFTSDRDHPKSCVLVESEVTGDVLAFCHYEIARCGFKMNLTDVHRKCLLTSRYGDLPTLASGHAPETDTLLVAFTLRQFPDNDLVPHFEGYLGEHISSNYPVGTRQLSGPLLVRRRSNAAPATNRRRQSSPYIRYQKKIPASNSRYQEIDDLPRQVQTAPARLPARNAEAGPSRLPMESASQRVPAPFPLRLESLEPVGKDVKQLRKLIAGEGISEEALDGLIEKCTKCRRYFMACALKAHVKMCLGEIVLL
ncbi:hypothetical protein B0H13DRAFT_2356853 [Mycena leptocephala]|nr:hypothetical protein B0H13DRAFT_2356853 [Mycena leptocephala]